MNAEARQPDNPIQGPATRPEWAQTIRRGGDAVSVLVQSLRREVGRMEGLSEELARDEDGWNPRYRMGEHVLFRMRITPGVLEVLMSLDAGTRDALLRSPRLGAAMKQAVREAVPEGAGLLVRLRLTSQAAASRFAKLVTLRSTLLAQP